MVVDLGAAEKGANAPGSSWDFVLPALPLQENRSLKVAAAKRRVFATVIQLPE
jgi:hypothetical protein